MRRNSRPYSRSLRGRRQRASGGDEDLEQAEIGGSLDETMSKVSKMAELLPVVLLFVNSQTRTTDWNLKVSHSILGTLWRTSLLSLLRS